MQNVCMHGAFACVIITAITNNFELHSCFTDLLNAVSVSRA